MGCGFITITVPQKHHMGDCPDLFQGRYPGIPQSPLRYSAKKARPSLPDRTTCPSGLQYHCCVNGVGFRLLCSDKKFLLDSRRSCRLRFFQSLHHSIDIGPACFRINVITRGSWSLTSRIFDQSIKPIPTNR